MEISSLAAAATIACAAALITVVPAAAAPSGPGSAADTVAALEARGYKVIVNKDGNARLDKCTVRAIRPGRVISDLTRDPQERTGQRAPFTTYTTVHVDASC